MAADGRKMPAVSAKTATVSSEGAVATPGSPLKRTTMTKKAGLSDSGGAGASPAKGKKRRKGKRNAKAGASSAPKEEASKRDAAPLDGKVIPGKKLTEKLVLKRLNKEAAEEKVQLAERKDDGRIHDLRVAMVGNVDSGKSTLIGVLTGGQLDDGRGLARSKVFAHRHEAASGRTSCISQHIVGIDSKGELVHSNKTQNLTAAAKTKAWRECVSASDSIITLVDLAGHEKYLKTTIGGLTGCFPDYACLIIGANMGITKMTKEHLHVVLALKIPLCCVVTKIDICPSNVLSRTKRHLFRILRSRGKQPYLVKDSKDVETCLKHQSTKITPVFFMSAVTGKGLKRMQRYLTGLRPRQSWDDEAKTVAFNIEETFNVTGVGVVVSGTATNGRLVANSNMLLGPFSDGLFKPVLARTIQRKRVPVSVCNAGESCAVAVKSLKRKDPLKRAQIRRGMVLVDPTSSPTSTISFEADVLVLHHPTTIRKNYQAVVHCGIIRQTAKMVSIAHRKSSDSNEDCLRTGDKASVLFRFMVRPEHVHEGTTIIFREGTTKGVGRITKVYNDSFKNLAQVTDSEIAQSEEAKAQDASRRIRVPKTERGNT